MGEETPSPDHPNKAASSYIVDLAPVIKSFIVLK
jgi:hypothetical protein